MEFWRFIVVFSHFDISNTVMLVVDFLYFLAFSTFACFSGLQ